MFSLFFLWLIVPAPAGMRVYLIAADFFVPASGKLFVPASGLFFSSALPETYGIQYKGKFLVKQEISGKRKPGEIRREGRDS